jgi:hypothetical protein
VINSIDERIARVVVGSDHEVVLQTVFGDGVERPLVTARLERVEASAETDILSNPGVFERKGPVARRPVYRVQHSERQGQCDRAIKAVQFCGWNRGRKRGAQAG